MVNQKIEIKECKTFGQKIDSILDLTGARGKVGFDLLKQDMTSGLNV